MKRVSLKLVVGAVAVSLAAWNCPLLGQQTSTSPFGSRTTGGAGGTTAPRNTSAPRTSTGGTSAEQPSLMQEASGTVSGNERYIRGNRQGQFVGAGSEDARLTGVSQAIGAGGPGGQANRMGGRNGNILGQLIQSQFNPQAFNMGGQAGRTPIRIPIRLGFTPNPAPPAKFTAQFATRLGRLPALTTVGPIEVQLEGETVVLRGTVASEGDRQLAEEIALLEPGVSKVKNELQVQEADTNAAEPPAPTSENP